jgi:hypothetical protein
MITVIIEDDISVCVSKEEFSFIYEKGGKIQLTVEKAKELVKALEEKIDACDAMSKPFNGQTHLSDKDQETVDKGIKPSIIL